MHTRTVVACVIVPGTTRQPRKTRRTFSTMTEDVRARADGWAAAEVTQVALESTGSFWQPLGHRLEDRFTLLLANAQHVKAVPGRKTDVKDCEWLADRLRPFAEAVERLDGIPGVGRTTAGMLLAEIGPARTRFPSTAPLASWAGRCPGHHASAGKRLSGQTRKGSTWLRTALVEAAQAAGRRKHGSLAAPYRRWRPVGVPGRRRSRWPTACWSSSSAYLIAPRRTATAAATPSTRGTDARSSAGWSSAWRPSALEPLTPAPPPALAAA